MRVNCILGSSACQTVALRSIPSPSGRGLGEVGGPLELAHEAELDVGALVVVELRVGVPHCVGHHKLRAEAVQGEGAVVDRGAQDAGLVLAGLAARREGGPAAFVVRPAELAAAAQGEAERQGHRDAHPPPTGGVPPARRLRAFLCVSARRLGPDDGRYQPGAAER